MAEMREAAFGAGAGAVGVTEQDLPLAFRMVENIPGIAASAGFMAFRGSNTLVEGGRFDYKGGRRGKRLQRKFRVLDQSAKISGINNAQYLGGGRLGGGLLGARAARKVEKAKTAATAVTGRGYGVASNFNFRAARANVITANPSAARRLGSITSFMDPSKGIYSPFAMSGLLNRSTKLSNYLGGKMGITLGANEAAFGPGLLSFISAGRRIDRIEKKALRGNQRAINKLGRIDDNIKALASVNNRAMFTTAVSGGTPLKGTPLLNPRLNKVGKPIGPSGGIDILMPDGTIRNYGSGKYLPANPMLPNYGPTMPGASVYDDAMKTAVRQEIVAGKRVMVGEVGVRGSLMGEAMSGNISRGIQGYFKGAMGKPVYTESAKKGAELAIKHMGSKGATKAMALGAKGLGLAIPGLNVLATAALVYDLGKMAGEVVKSGINLAKDANKSLQGTINKPLFGMGYKDTEAAATSRSRGVMAIQNSRLNARSMLGSEAAMMAAHYG